jgi:predicted TPR repeat methyltransferase
VGHASVDPDAFDAFEAAGWEEKAAAYERSFGDIAGRVVEPLLTAAAVGPATRVPDVAPGPGWVAARAAGRGASVVGVDVAEAMIARARSAQPDLAEARAVPPAGLPPGPDFFRFSDDEEFAAALRHPGLTSPARRNVPSELVLAPTTGVAPG